MLFSDGRLQIIDGGDTTSKSKNNNHFENYLIYRHNVYYLLRCQFIKITVGLSLTLIYVTWYNVTNCTYSYFVECKFMYEP